METNLNPVKGNFGDIIMTKDEYFRANYGYDGNAGVLYRLDGSDRKVGSPIKTTKNNRGGPYVSIRYRDGGEWKMTFYHRVVWFLCKGTWPNHTIDHIDGDASNNKIENLRDVPISVNNQNKKAYKKNKTGYKGVRVEGGRYRSQITANKKSYFLGMHDTPEEAARAYDRKALELWGDRAVLNFPLDESLTAKYN